MNTDFVEITNQNTVENGSKGRKLTVKESTFCIDEGSYKGTITDAFWYKTAKEKDRVMVIFELEDGTEFKNSVNGDWIEEYPLPQADLSG